MKKNKIYDENDNFFGEIAERDIQDVYGCLDNYELPDAYDYAAEKLEEYREEFGEDPDDGYVLSDLTNLLEGDNTYAPYLHLEDGRKGMMVGDFFVLYPDGNEIRLDRQYVFEGGEIVEKNSVYYY